MGPQIHFPLPLWRYWLHVVYFLCEMRWSRFDYWCWSRDWVVGYLQKSGTQWELAMFLQCQMIFYSPKIHKSHMSGVCTSKDSRDIINGPSAEATLSRDLLFCLRCKFHALDPFSRPWSGGEGYFRVSIHNNPINRGKNTGRKVPELSTTISPSQPEI